MRIKKFQISNYKCFDKGNAVTLSRGMAVLTGKNSSGKTAALEALSLAFRGNPHRSLEKGIAQDGNSELEATCELTREEFLEAASKEQNLVLPAPHASSPFVRETWGSLFQIMSASFLLTNTGSLCDGASIAMKLSSG